MLSRWYSLFIGFLLLVLGIAGLVAGSRGYSGVVTASVFLLIIAVVALWVGFGVRNLTTVRWFAGIVGALLFLWGVIQLMATPTADTTNAMTAVATTAGLLVLLGSIGLASALVPATWLRDDRGVTMAT